MTNLLNPNQQQAVSLQSGAAMVIAGAGSGKTRVVTERIKSLIASGTAPYSILALTFTNKAAGEMQKRLEVFLKDYPTKPQIGTFHSFCLNLVRRYQKWFGLETSPNIIDPQDQASLLKKIFKFYNLDKEYNVNKVANQISAFKNQINQPAAAFFRQRIEHEIYTKYEQEKSQANLFDFDDLINRTYHTLASNPDFLAKLQANLAHIMIDEYQDTNQIQHELLKLLALNQEKKLAIESIFAVGDEDQAIYSWRGAVVENVQRFQNDFSPVSLIKIEQNYRSCQEILDAANAVIRNNATRNDKQLWSDKKEPHCLFWANCKNEYQEAQAVVNFVKLVRNADSDGEIAVLYRNHNQSRIVEEFFINNQINYKIVGGIRFYERKEIKDLLAYLKLLNNPYDQLSFNRVVNVPTRGLGDKVQTELQEIWQDNSSFDLYQVIQYYLENTENRKPTLQNFCQILNQAKEQTSLVQKLDSIMSQTNYQQHLEKQYENEELRQKLNNINELCRAIEKFETVGGQQNDLALFLQEVALFEQQTEHSLQPGQAPILMMSLHSAKGLEFDRVIIVGLEEGNLPSLRKDQPNQIEEERRLFYVGITRAKYKLMMLSCTNRVEYGSLNIKEESRFLDEIPNRLFSKFIKHHLHDSILAQEINTWLSGLSTRAQATSFYSDLPKPKFPQAFEEQDESFHFTSYRPQSSTSKPARLIKEHFKAADRYESSHFRASALKKTENSDEFRVGQKIVHSTFGQGIIIATGPQSNGEATFYVFFNTAGKKLLKKSFLSKNL